MAQFVLNDCFKNSKVLSMVQAPRGRLRRQIEEENKVSRYQGINVSGHLISPGELLNVEVAYKRRGGKRNRSETEQNGCVMKFT